MTRETVDGDTPAALATSLIVLNGCTLPASQNAWHSVSAKQAVVQTFALTLWYFAKGLANPPVTLAKYHGGKKWFPAAPTISGTN